MNVPSGATALEQLRSLIIANRALLGLQHVVVHFAEGRRQVDDAAAGVEGDEIGWHNAPSKVLGGRRLSGVLRVAPASCNNRPTAAR